MRAFIHMPETILDRVTEQMKIAMKARKKERVAALRLMLAELRNVEIDERIKLDDLRALAILDKMSKQRNDSKAQYREAGRKDLEEKEGFELSVIEEFMPEKLGEKEIVDLVDKAIRETGAEGMQDMGNIMSILKPKVQGKADMSMVSALVKSKLN